MNEINYSNHDLKKLGVIKNAAATLETKNAALDTEDIAKAEIDTMKSKNIKGRQSNLSQGKWSAHFHS